MGKRLARPVSLEPASTLRVVGRYRVLFADCDPMQVMYYANYLRLFEIGRAELFRALGHAFSHYVAKGIYLAVVEAQCRYLRPARYDDELEILAGFGEVGGARLRIDYLLRKTTGEVLATGFTRHAAVNEQGKPVRLPTEVRALLQRVIPARVPGGDLGSD